MIPEALDQLLLEMMAKDPADRPVDAHKVHKILVGIAGALGVRVPVEPTDDLVAYPPLLNVGPGETRRIRLGSSVAATSIEHAYRVILTQLAAPIERSNGVEMRMRFSIPVFVVPRDTPGAFPPSPRPIRGEDVKAALNGRSLPGTTIEQSQAYTTYIRRLQHGMSGFTCYASLQNPRG